MIKTTCLNLFFLLVSTMLFSQSFEDAPFLQAVSKKYGLPPGPHSDWKKIVVDRDYNVYALSGQGLYWLIDGKLTQDTRFLPLAGKVPTDICIQAGEGILYYLFDEHYLSNAHAGKPFGSFSKGRFNKIAVNLSGEVLLAGGREFSLIKADNISEGSIEEEILEVKTLENSFYIRSNKGLLKWNGKRFVYFLQQPDIRAWAVAEDVVYVSSGDDGIFAVSIFDGNTVLERQRKVPVLEVNALQFRDGNLWAATATGVFRTKNFRDYDYFASKRWLIDDEALNLAINARGDAFVLTANGVSEIGYHRMTLERKAEYFYDKIRKRHLRLGLIGETHFKEPGDMTTVELIDTDNDGLWTSFYLGSEVFRYAVTKDPVARKNAMESFESFERLLSINQLDGFPSRTFARKGFKVSDHDRWRDSPEQNWEWKGHTSSDEFVAYIWVAGILYRHLDLGSLEQERVTNFMESIMMHLLDNDYYFVDVDGKPTLWGRWNPEYINSYPETVVDRKLGSLTITAGLQLVYALTGKEIYRKEAYRLFEEHGYLKNIQLPLEQIGYTPGVIYQGRDMGMGGWNHSDDEMAFLTYWILYHYAFDEQLKEIYAKVICDHWAIEKPERNALWNLVSFGTCGQIDLPSVKWHLQKFQLDMIRWNIKNSHRRDLKFLPPNFRGQSTEQLLSPVERPTMRHNGNPFLLDGGSKGMRELAGDEYLLPYWMGRYLNVIRNDKTEGKGFGDFPEF